MKLAYKQLKDCKPGQFILLPGMLMGEPLMYGNGMILRSFWMPGYDDAAKGGPLEGHALCMRYLMDIDTATISQSKKTNGKHLVAKVSTLEFDNNIYPRVNGIPVVTLAGRMDRHGVHKPSNGHAMTTLYDSSLMDEKHPYGHCSTLPGETMVVVLDEDVIPTDDRTRADILKQMFVALWSDETQADVLEGLKEDIMDLDDYYCG